MSQHEREIIVRRKYRSIDYLSAKKIFRVLEDFSASEKKNECGKITRHLCDFIRN